MGISPKTETRCHNFSFFGRQDFQKRDFRKTRNCGSAFQFLGECPYPIGAPRALRRSLSVALRYGFSVPARTDCRLAKFHGLMRKIKYGAVIGWKGTHSLVIHTGHIQKIAFPDHSQRRISPFSSNHGISPDDSVNYSG